MDAKSEQRQLWKIKELAEKPWGKTCKACGNPNADLHFDLLKYVLEHAPG